MLVFFLWGGFLIRGFRRVLGVLGSFFDGLYCMRMSIFLGRSFDGSFKEVL